MRYVLYGPDNANIVAAVEHLIDNPERQLPGVIADMFEEDESAQMWCHLVGGDHTTLREEGYWLLERWHSKSHLATIERRLRGLAVMWVSTKIEESEHGVEGRDYCFLAIVAEILCSNTDCISAAALVHNGRWFCHYHHRLGIRQETGEPAVDPQEAGEIEIAGRAIIGTVAPPADIVLTAVPITSDLEPIILPRQRLFGEVDERTKTIYIGGGVWCPSVILARTGLTVEDLVRVGLEGQALIDYLNRVMRG